MADTQHQPIPLEVTDFSRFVIEAIKAGTTGTDAKLDQVVLRTSLELASSYLVTDTTTNVASGSQSWLTGLQQLVDILVALHARDELELDTLNAASKACSECWSVTGAWRDLENCRDGVRKVGAKLRRLLDEEGFTYRGEAVYSPLAPARPTPRLPPPSAAAAAAES